MGVRYRSVDFRYQLVNEAFARTLGEPVDVPLGSCLLELYPSHVELGLFDAYCRVVETGEPYVCELSWFDERDLRAFLEVHVTAFHDGYLMTGSDVTEAKMGEQVSQIFDSSEHATGGEAASEHGIRTSRSLGTPEVEVWCGFSHRCLLGFVVIDVNGDGNVQVRRPNGVVLPEALHSDMVRPVTGWSDSSWNR